MAIPILIILGALIFIWGLIFIVRGLRNPPADEAVPISDIKEWKHVHKAAHSARAKETAVSLTDHLLNENLQKSTLKSPESAPEVSTKGVTAQTPTDPQQSLKEAQRKIEDLTRDNQKLKDALELELSSRKLKTVSEDEQKRFAEQNKQLQIAQQAVEGLTTENRKLAQTIDGHKEKISQLEQTISGLKEEKKQTGDQDKQLFLIQQANEELTRTSHKLQQQLDAEKQKNGRLHEEADALKNENSLLQGQEEVKRKILEEQVAQLRKDHEGFDQFKRNLENLKSEYQQIVIEKKVLEEKLELTRHANDEKLKDAKENFQSLSIQQQESIQKQIQVIGERLSSAMETIAGLKNENETVKKHSEEIIMQLRKTKEFNGHLLEKERMLQYELAKSRAQALGLEKICEDFKLQIEEMAKSLPGTKG